MTIITFEKVELKEEEEEEKRRTMWKNRTLNKLYMVMDEYVLRTELVPDFLLVIVHQ